MFKELLREHDDIKRNESDFKQHCRQEIEQMDAEIDQLRKPKLSSDGTIVTTTQDEETLRTLTQRIESLSQQAAQVNRDIFYLERQVESQPSQIELNQYQRRFIELYNQMSSKHRDTKRHYTLYNTLLDVRNFIKREIDLLNNIDDQRALALKDSYKDSFLDNLQKICRSVEESLEKIVNRKKELVQQKDELSDNLQVLINKQRLYTKTLVEFQMECNRNVQLREQLEGSTGEQ
jgi:hypothetical protein